MADGDNKKKRSGIIATLSDLRHNQSDSDSDGPQEYYTGGEKSGMMVQDPSTHRKDVESIFDRARQLGARQGNGDASSSAFSGTGRTLAGHTTDVKQLDEGAMRQHAIIFWRNGFTVDDGPLRRLDDPANFPFLQSIERGECPRELESDSGNLPTEVHLMQRDEEWKPPAEPKYRAFQGLGRTVGNSSGEAPQAGASTVAGVPFRGIVVDELKPFTSLQLRLADGTRMVARFNHHHTVGDIHAFIDAARVGGPKSYVLQVMGFPPKILSDPSMSIREAGLQNAVVIQKVN